MADDRIVEVYAAANPAEAHALCAMLEEEGIQAQVVGESLAGAAGCLPLGETIAPRIWVREGDAARARELIAANTPQPGMVPPGTGEEPAEEPAAEEAGEQTDVLTEAFEPEEEAPPGRAGLTLVGKAFVAAGLASVIWGSYDAWQNWTLLRTHPATTQAVRTGVTRFLDLSENSVPVDPNLPGALPGIDFGQRGYRWRYAYDVDGVTYGIRLKTDSWQAPQRITVHYNPRDPAEYIVGPVRPPWVCLLLGLAIAAPLMLVAWAFR